MFQELMEVQVWVFFLSECFYHYTEDNISPLRVNLCCQCLKSAVLNISEYPSRSKNIWIYYKVFFFCLSFFVHIFVFNIQMVL